MNINKMNYQTLSEERKKFEKRWNYFNNIRTVIAFSVSLILLSIVTMR
jgi:hypothetical protein